jgi:hypothetical protein
MDRVLLNEATRRPRGTRPSVYGQLTARGLRVRIQPYSGSPFGAADGGAGFNGFLTGF